jgi:hypothetical protein
MSGSQQIKGNDREHKTKENKGKNRIKSSQTARRNVEI